ESRDRAIVEIAVVSSFLAVLLVDAAFRRLESHCRAVLREAAFNAHAVGDVLYRIISGGLVGDAAVPGRAGPFLGIAPQRSRGRIVRLHVQLRIVFPRLSGFRIQALGPVQVVDVLSAFDEPSIRAVQRIEKAVAAEMADYLAGLTANDGVVEHVDANLV